MKPFLFVCYPRCTTCQKARKWLDERGYEYIFRDIKTDNPTKEELRAWHAKSGLPLKRFFNTSGIPYREGKVKERLPNMDEEARLNLLATNGMMVKRPIVVAEGFVLVGFRPEEWESAFGRS